MGKLLIKYGLLHTINKTNQARESAEILNDFDEIVLSDPNDFSVTDRLLYFEVLNLVKKKVWVYISTTNNQSYVLNQYMNLYDNFVDIIKPKIDGIINAFSYFGMLDKLKGFFVDEFGYDYTVKVNTVPQTSRRVNRYWQNHIVNYCHSLGYPVFVNLWFLDDCFITFAPYYGSPPYLGSNYPLDNDIQSGSLLPESSVGSGNWRGLDYVLLESCFWNNDSNSLNLARILYEVGVMRRYYDRVKWACVQGFNFGNRVSVPNPPDGTLIVDEGFREFIKKYIEIMNLLGVQYVGVSDIDYSAVSDIVLDIKYDFQSFGICEDVWGEREGNKIILKIKNGGIRAYEIP